MRSSMWHCIKKRKIYAWPAAEDRQNAGRADDRTDGQQSERWFGALAVAPVEDWTYVSAHVRFKGTGRQIKLSAEGGLATK